MIWNHIMSAIIQPEREVGKNDRAKEATAFSKKTGDHATGLDCNPTLHCWLNLFFRLAIAGDRGNIMYRSLYY